MEADVLIKIALFFPPFLFALCFHEFAHGYIAKLRGDNTAEMMGRLSMNPLAHVDWIGTVGLPLISIVSGLPLFGWAKPVPVNPRNLKNQKNDMFWVALAGPLSNVLLFLLGLLFFYIIIHYTQLGGSQTVAQMLVMFLSINLYLAIFNMIPVHPLDGGKIIERFIPYQWNRFLEDNQQTINMVFLFLLIFGGLRYLAAPVQYIIQGSLGFIASGAL